MVGRSGGAVDPGGPAAGPWRSVSAIVVRVVAELAGRTDRLDELRRIGVDEISYRKGQRFLLYVVDHDTGRLVWAGKDRNATTVRAFFDLLGETRSAQLMSPPTARSGSTTSCADAPRRR